MKRRGSSHAKATPNSVGSYTGGNPTAANSTPPVASTSATSGESERRTSAPTKRVRPLPASQAEPKPSLDDIRRRAYEIYLMRQQTGRGGSSDSDWAEAEHELLNRLG